jgi:hypothetical protein
MNKMQEFLLRAGRDLNIQVVAPFELVLDSGKKISAEALFPQLGAPKGTIVYQSINSYQEILDEIKKMGYTCSVFGEPLPNEEYDPESYKEMFTEWGWTGENNKKPAWFLKPIAMT